MKGPRLNQWSLKKLLKRQRQKVILVFTQRTSVISSPKLKNSKTIETISHTEVTDFLPQTSSNLIPDKSIPLQVPTKITRSKHDSQHDPNITETSASKDDPFDATNHQFHLKKLQLYHVCNLIELKEENFCMIHSLIIEINFIKTQLLQINQIYVMILLLF